jgi:hypothetical protein
VFIIKRKPNKIYFRKDFSTEKNASVALIIPFSKIASMHITFYSSVVGDKCIKKGESFLKKIKFTSCIPGKYFTFKETLDKLLVSVDKSSALSASIFRIYV